APAAFVGPGRLPERFARLLIEPHNEGVFFAVAILDQHITDQNRAGRHAPGAFEVPQVARPDVLAIDRITMQAADPEEREDQLAVGHTRSRRPAVHDMAFFRLAGPGDLLPE